MSRHGSGIGESGKGRPRISGIASVIGAIAKSQKLYHVEVKGKHVEGGDSGWRQVDEHWSREPRDQKASGRRVRVREIFSINYVQL